MCETVWKKRCVLFSRSKTPMYPISAYQHGFADSFQRKSTALHFVSPLPPDSFIPKWITSTPRWLFVVEHCKLGAVLESMKRHDILFLGLLVVEVFSVSCRRCFYIFPSFSSWRLIRLHQHHTAYFTCLFSSRCPIFRVSLFSSELRYSMVVSGCSQAAI